MSQNIFKLVNEGNLSEIQGLIAEDANVIKQRDEVVIMIEFSCMLTRFVK